MTGFYATGEVATGSVIDASTTPPAGDNENPILSAPTVTGTSSGAVTGSINTNEGTGTLFFVAAGAMPTATAIKARGSQLVISAGAQTVSISNLAAGTYQLYFLHRDAAGNDSDIATTGSFDVVVLPPLGQVVTDAEFAAWWETDDAIVNILFEVWPLVDHVPTLLRWSTLGYMSPGTANPIFYEPGMSFDVMPTESLPLDGGASISAGNLEIENLDRSREYLKRYVWKNRPFIARVGDLRWGPADYRIIRVGQTDSLVPKDDHTLALHLRDMTERLNAPLSEHKLGGDGPNQDALYPLAFGECHNVTGLVTELLTRSYHDGPIEAVKVVRSNALKVDFTADVATGLCDISINNQGAAITATIQGDKFGGVYRNTIAALVQRIVTGFGKDGDRYTVDDIDLDNFRAFEAAHQQKVGLWVPDRMTVLDACAALASSVDARLCSSIDGKLRLIQIAIPAAGPSLTILPHHIDGFSMKPVQHIDAVAAVKLGFCKNWTVEPGLNTNVSGEVRQLFADEWLTDTKVNEARKVELQLEGDPAQRNTKLLRRADTHAEVERLEALWGPGRDVYEFIGMPGLMQIQVGQGFNLTYPDFGMENGVDGQVLAVTRSPETRRVTVRILV